ncbi:Gfo/Idh/MocA family protein [Planctomycetota bacterium]
MSQKLRFIMVGLGNRNLGCFAKGLLGFPTKGFPEFREKSEIVALVDPNRSRAQAANTELKQDYPIYPSVEAAAAEVQADWAIITTPDFTHGNVAVAALDCGLNIVIDKPLATSVWECNRIIEARDRNKKQVIVGHNYRYHAYTLAAARLVREGAIGKVLQVEAAEVLSYSHGGDYFHRWHSEFNKSAGLMNHKCCHFIDLINWIIDDSPVGVNAMGDRTFYVPRPDMKHGDRCSECEIGKDCPHFVDMEIWDGIRRKMYIESEHEDGYKRDLCVFTDRHSINDREVLNLRYKSGITASFSMVTFNPTEYNYFFFTGTEGRLELGRDSKEHKSYLRHIKADGTVEDLEFDIEHGEHGHGGADVKLLASILGMEDIAGEIDPLQVATAEQARDAVAVADMAARSIADGGRYIGVEETGKDYPPSPPGGKS